ncbi:MAG TPA: ABC transporter permease [Acidimicrobiales bacterium]|jgi:branched-chain amino acid transport system permease protein|nr:ABC transporter permease [Acidimicrobiales bacterium]
MQTFFSFTVSGLAVGAIYAIAATGLVVTFTTSGVFNFAHGATGMLAAFTYWQLRVAWHWSAPAALIVVIALAAPLFGMGVERALIRALDPNDFATTLVVTVGLLVASIGIADTIWWRPQARVIPALYGPFAFVKVFGVRISYQELISIGLAILVAVVLRFLFFRTRMGVAMRGVVDDRPLMALNGGYPTRLNALSWAIGASLAAVAGIIQASGPNGGGLSVLDLTFLIVNAFAAAILGRLKSLPLTFVGAIAIGLLNAYVEGYVTLTGWLSNLEPVLPTLFLFAIVLIVPAARLKAGAARATASLPVPSMRRSVFSGAGFVVLAIIIVQFISSGVVIVQASEGVAVGVVGLSVVLLTGYGGQISLAQYAFMGFGAWLFGKLSPGGSIFGLIGVALVSAGLGAIVILPTLRLRGLYLALSTLAFAELSFFIFFDQQSIMGGGVLDRVPRVHLPGLKLGTNKSELVFECVVFALLAIAVLAVRRGSLGRLLMATRDSSAATATLGGNLNLTKLLLFAGSSAIAGVGGALWGGVEGTVNDTNFEFQFGLTVVLLVYIWGITSPTAALLGGLSFSLVFPQVASHLSAQYAQIGYILTGFGAVALGRNANGTIGQISGIWQDMRLQASDRWPGLAPPPSADPTLDRDLYLGGHSDNNGEVMDLVTATDR